MPDTALMSIPGRIDPVPVARDVTPRADGRVDLIGLPRQRIAELFAEAGLEPKQARLRAKQVFHWLYHRGVTGFEAMRSTRPSARGVTSRATGTGSIRPGMLIRAVSGIAWRI